MEAEISRARSRHSNYRKMRESRSEALHKVLGAVDVEIAPGSGPSATVRAAASAMRFQLLQQQEQPHINGKEEAITKTADPSNVVIPQNSMVAEASIPAKSSQARCGVDPDEAAAIVTFKKVDWTKMQLPAASDGGKGIRLDLSSFDL